MILKYTLYFFLLYEYVVCEAISGCVVASYIISHVPWESVCGCCKYVQGCVMGDSYTPDKGIEKGVQWEHKFLVSKCWSRG